MSQPSKTQSAEPKFSQLQGYIAASIVIEEALNQAEKNKPKRYDLKARRTAAYRQGRIDGLMFAFCQKAMGEFPENNIEHIKAAFKTP